MTQCQAILEVLERGNTITPAEAYELCGTLACHSRIAELRERGYYIVCELIETTSHKHVGRYSLLEPIPFAGWI